VWTWWKARKAATYFREDKDGLQVVDKAVMVRKANKYLKECTEDHQVLHGEKEDQLVPERNRERPLGTVPKGTAKNTIKQLREGRRPTKYLGNGEEGN
jgi:hypothetical protein